MEYSLLIILYYGMLHALAPDHLSAIAIFSVGKDKKESLLLSLLFAFGHGLTLYFLALFIEYIADDSLLQYGDFISGIVIILMGGYLIYLAASNKVRINKHKHGNEQHTHIYYADAHLHDKGLLFSLGLLMGIGGIRGMLVTLSIVSHHTVNIDMVLAFVAGVSIVFLLFGFLIYLINEFLAVSENAFRFAIAFVGFVSVSIGTYNLSGLDM